MAKRKPDLEKIKRIIKEGIRMESFHEAGRCIMLYHLQKVGKILQKIYVLSRNENIDRFISTEKSEAKNKKKLN